MASHFSSRRGHDLRDGGDDGRGSSGQWPRRAHWLAESLLILVLVVCVCCGCSTHAQQLTRTRDQFYAGQLAAARSTLQQQAEQRPSDANVVLLDEAMIDLVSGQPAEAESKLRLVRDRFDALAGPDYVEQGVSLLTDDQRVAYAGSSYEQVLVRVFLALSNLVHDGTDAEAYSLQVNAVQRRLAAQLTSGSNGDDPVDAGEFQPLAIGPYLHGLLREATWTNYDDALRSYRQVAAWQPEFSPIEADLRRVEQGVHSRKGSGVVYVIALVGRGPYREQVIEQPSSRALLVADRIISAMGPYELPPTIAPIKVPRVVVPVGGRESAQISVDGSPGGRTEVICDIASLALRHQQAEMPHLMARAIARRVVKKAAVVAVKDGVDVEPGMADMALSMAGVLWEATESADTRCWGLLPREIQLARLELPAGRHRLSVTPDGGQGQGTGTATVDLQVVDGRNTYVLACLADRRLIGSIQQYTP